MNTIRTGVKYNFVKLILVLVVVIISISSLCKRKPDNNLEPTNVSNNSGRSENPSIAVDSRNTVHLVWNDNTPGIVQGNQWNQEILYAYKPVDSNWSNPVNISNSPCASRFPCIKVDRNDKIHIVWQDCSPDYLWRIFYICKSPGGSWSLPETIWTSGADLVPAIDVDSIGRVFLVWYAGDYSGWVYFSLRQGDANWTLPINISPRGFIDSPKITVDIRGNAHVAWSQWNGDVRTDIFYVMRDTNGNWSDTFAIFPTRDISFTPVLTSDREGNVHITWNDSALTYMYKSIEGNWSNPEFPVLHGNPGGIEVDANRTIFICYGSTRLIKKQQNSSWAQPLLVYESGNSNPSLAIDRRGTKHIAWHCTPPDTIDTSEVYYIEIKNY